MTWSHLRKGRFSQSGQECFITFNCEKRRPLFTEAELAKAFCRYLSINEDKFSCQWLSWVLMPDHFHGLVKIDHYPIEKVIKDLKGSTARFLNKRRKDTGPLWQKNFYDHALRVEEDRLTISRYIVSNPVRAGIVKSVRFYPYWNSVYF